MRNPSCTLCPLHEGVRSVCIESDGDPMARVLLLGEAPGADEDEVGKPFVGRSGRLLREALKALPFQVLIGNSVRCRPPGNRKPQKEELKACSPYLEEDVRGMPNLEVVVVLGEIPARVLGLKGKILEMSGSAHDVVLFGRPVKAFVLAHPAYVLRNPSYLANWKAHWDSLKNLLVRQDDAALRIGATFPARVGVPAEAGVLGLDLETSSLDPQKGSILAVGLSAASGTTGVTVGSPDDLNALETILRGPGGSEPGKVAVHDVRMEGTWSEEWFGVRLTGDRVVDTKLLANRVYPGQPANLAALVARHLPEISGYKGDTDALIKAGRVLEIPKEDLRSRVAVDAYATRMLVPILSGLLPAEALPWVAEDVDLALCVERMAKRGVPFDEGKAFEIKAACERVQEEVRGRYFPVNPGSSQQVGTLLQSLGVELPLSKAGNPETGEIVLQAASHYSTDERIKRVCKDILDYREAQKLRTTYVEGYAKRRSPDGRLRSDLWWPGTFSWRLASSDPNLQNVPMSFRSVIGGRKGFCLVEADLAQAELRIGAALAPEPLLIEVFMAGGDPHGLFAERLFGKGYTKDQRHTAKTGNFQLRYGAGAHGFWKMLAQEGKFIEMSEARRVHSGFWSGYQGFAADVERQYEILRAGGAVFAPTGGYRWTLEDGRLKHPEDEGEALRCVENARIQAIPPRWTLRAAMQAEKEGIDVILQTHDGLLAEVPESEVISQGRRLKEIMEEVSSEGFMNGLPVPADVKWGPLWGDMQPLVLR